MQRAIGLRAENESPSDSMYDKAESVSHEIEESGLQFEKHDVEKNEHDKE
jgi:hypothetical protein